MSVLSCRFLDGRPARAVVGRAPRRTGRLAVVLALLVGWAGGCTPAPAPPAPTDTGFTPLPPIRPYCVAQDEGTFWSPPGADGNDGALLTLGSGRRSILLVPQSDGDICQWLPEGRRLAALGYRVGLMNWGQPSDRSVVTAYRRMQATGGSPTVVVGASMGGAYALFLAAELAPVGVASISGEASGAGVDVIPQLQRYRGPLLLIGSRTDPYDPASTTVLLARQHPGPEDVVVVGGDEHGMALLTGDHGSRVTAALDRFLETSFTR